ncbi:MAG: hypothetical protein QXR45_06365 [Candidatus Bathyarchaeia archaeon]
MKNRFLKVATTTLTALLLLSMLAGLQVFPVKAAITTLKIINPGLDGYPAKWTASEPDAGTIGTAHFNFTGDQYGKTFFINVTIQNAQNVKGWGIGIIFDSAVLEYVSAWRPPDHIFAEAEARGWTIVAPAVAIEDIGGGLKLLKWGCTYIMGEPEWSFTGDGTLCQIQFKIMKSVNRVYPLVTSEFNWDPDWTAVYFHPTGSEVPNLEKGYLKIQWAAPIKVPIFYVKPAIVKPEKLGDDVAVEVWVRDVEAGWSIIAFQFALWFNTTCLQATYYEVGTWLDGFANNGESVLYIAQNDFHGDPSLPYCYNKWFCGAVILPTETGEFVPPFPSGEGMLFRLHFTAIKETLFPMEPECWTTLQIREEEVYDMFGMKVPIGVSEHAQYRCPIKFLGLQIDLYTQYVFPYGGQGLNNPSDMFAPQAEVVLNAKVLYNDYPVQMKLVAFEVRHGEFYIYREAYTSEDGIATVKFRIPWPCVNPVERVFGKWCVIATVEVAEQVKNDTLCFMVWWPVEITSVYSKYTEYYQNKLIGQPQPDMEFTVEYRTLSMQIKPVVLTVTVYDELGFFIGYVTFETTVGWGEYHLPIDEFKTYSHDFTVPLPTNAVVGEATVYANAYNKLPWLGGVPYCPEASNKFWIKKP